MSSGPSKVIVLEPDVRAGRQVQLGLEREGVPAFMPAIPADLAALDWNGTVPGVVLVGGEGPQALDLVRRAKALLGARKADVPLVFAGRGAARRELEAAGADEVLARPLYLRDLVTIARLLRGVPHDRRDHLVGSLAETTGVLTLVRAFSALGRSAVLTLVRGLRRGEVRFFHGEVTSAQVGLIHGQAALHQLLLWTDARFDYALEDIVRRQQIPLTPEELFADADQFLEGVREHAGQLSPATVLEQDVQRIHALGKSIPTEVHGVLRMFDGHRVLADILEDSPYRVFETLRVAQKAVEVGLLREVSTQRPKATWRAVLAIEEWLVGTETRDAVVERTQTLDSGPVSTTAVTAAKKKFKRGKRRSKKMKALTPPPDTKDIDWGALVPRVIGAEVGPLSGVVPAQQTHGEVELPTRDKPREGLEGLDTEKRQRIFPTDIGLEPSIVVADAVAIDSPRAPTSPSTPAATPPSTPATTPPSTPAPSTSAATASASAATASATATTAGAPPTETAPSTRATKRAATTRGDMAGLADTPPAGMPTTTEAAAAALLASRPGLDGGHARGRIANLPPTPPGADEIDPATANIVAVPQYLGEMTSDPVAAVTAVPAETSAPRDVRPGVTDAKQLVRALVDEVVPREEATSGPAPVAAVETKSQAVTAPVRPTDNLVTSQFVKPNAGDTPPPDGASAMIAEPILLAEAPGTSVAVTDIVAVERTDQTAIVTASPRVVISEQPATSPVASLEPARTASKPDDATPQPARSASKPDDATVAPARTAKPDDATPQQTDDEPSDGVVRALIAVADTARVARAARMRPPAPEHDGPPIKETTGEIRQRPRTETKEPAVTEPSILVADLAEPAPPVQKPAEPAALLADLAAAHQAIAAVAPKAAATPPPGDAASPSRELAVSDVRRDAVAFSDAEEAFFRGADKSAPVPRVADTESFDDLDEGYQPPKFWDRVFGRKPKKP